MFILIALGAILSTLFKFEVAASEASVYQLFQTNSDAYSKENPSSIPGLVYAGESDESETEDSEEDADDHPDDLADLYLFSRQSEWQGFLLTLTTTARNHAGSVCCGKKNETYPAVFILLENFRI